MIVVVLLVVGVVDSTIMLYLYVFTFFSDNVVFVFVFVVGHDRHTEAEGKFHVGGARASRMAIYDRVLTSVIMCWCINAEIDVRVGDVDVLLLLLL